MGGKRKLYFLSERRISIQPHSYMSQDGMSQDGMSQDGMSQDGMSQDGRIETHMTIGDKVRASFPYAGVPACDGKIIKALVLGNHLTQFLVNFEVRPRVYKKFYLTERELTLCPVLEIQQS